MRRALPATALLLLLALMGGAAQAQVALDVTSASQTALTWTHTVGSGSNLVMVVAVSMNGVSSHVSTVAWSGTSPTFSCLYALNYGDSASSCGGNGGGSARRVEIWGAALGTPATKTGTITVTLSASTQVVAGSASFSGAAQSGSFGTAQGTTGTNSPSSLAFSGLSANAAVVDDIAISTSQPITSLGSGQTQLWKAANGSNVYGSASYKTGAVTGMSEIWTGGSTHWAYVAVPINPAPPAGRKGQTVVGRLDPIRGTVVPETTVN